MSKIKYKLSQVDGQVIEGEAERVFVKDALNILSIGAKHAPLIAVLSEGSLNFETAGLEALSFSYVEGMLYCKNGQIDISLIQ